MRVFACVLALLVAGCGQPSAPHPGAAGTTTSAAVTTVNPANVKRVRMSLPPGYEFSALPPDASPVALWGIGTSWTSDPPQCAGVLAPTSADTPLDGWSASGAGGIVYAVAATAHVGSGPDVPGECASWTIATQHTSAAVTMVDAPPLPDATTVGATADVTTKVEGGSETHSQTQTFVAYLGEYLVYVVVVTDPGASGPALAPGFAAKLLGDAVSALRG
jgi:hypothetical protein